MKRLNQVEEVKEEEKDSSPSSVEELLKQWVLIRSYKQDSTEIHSLDELRSSSDSERSSKKVSASGDDNLDPDLGWTRGL